MKKNYPCSFKIDKELDDLLNEILTKLNEESNIKIDKSNFIRASLKRICEELKYGSLSSAELLYRTK